MLVDRKDNRMRRAIFVVTVMVAAVLIGTSAVAYAKQSDNKKTSPETTSQKATSPETTSQGATEPITTEAHKWGDYHWARGANPFTLKVGDNVTSAWDSYLQTTSTDWSADRYGNPVRTSLVAGGTNPKNCRARNGRVEVCNSTYGSNGWLGVASIWLNGSHISQATTKLNDTYFNTSTYNKPAWRNLVMCQEVGHDFGLGHQDEDFKNANLDTCMDYTNSPDSNQHPNQHDYDLLALIYGHDHPSTTIGQTSASDENEPGNGPPAWGREISRSADGQESIFEKDLGNGKKKLTHVLWTLEKAAQHQGGGPAKDHEHEPGKSTQDDGHTHDDGHYHDDGEAH